MNATLALEDGTWYRGVAAGASGEARGEVVFNTSMTGYQEVLTDPSYAGQIVTMTAPQIGNYGVAEGDEESQSPRVAGFIVREASPLASNWRADGTLRDYLVRHNIVAIGDVDTRALTRILRSAGVMRGVIATGQVDPAELVARANSIPKMEGADLVKDVTCGQSYSWDETEWAWGEGYGRQKAPRFHVVAIDYGLKRNILRELASAGCKVTVVPATASAEEVLERNPDGVFLSNGPGDPAATGVYAVPEIQKLVLSTLTSRLLRTEAADLPRLAGVDQTSLRDLRTTRPSVEALPRTYSEAG